MGPGEWSVSDWIAFISLHPELVRAARSIKDRYDRNATRMFIVAVAASHAKREDDSTASFTLPNERTVRQIISAFSPGARVIDFAARRTERLAREAGLEDVHISSLIPPSNK